MPEDKRRREGTPGSANPNECYECKGLPDITHHVVPYSMGGDITIPLCHKCHGRVHGKDLFNMSKLAKEKRLQQSIDGTLKQFKYSNDIAYRAAQLYADGMSTYKIAKLFIFQGIFPNVPTNWQQPPGTVKAQMKRETAWVLQLTGNVAGFLKRVKMHQNAGIIISSSDVKNKTQLTLLKGSNVPSLFTETLQPAFDLKTTATPGTWNFSQWAWNAEQDT